jgi:hypothetical protein
MHHHHHHHQHAKLKLKEKFHVDKLSSAHIYLRLPEGENWEDIPADLLTDCAQLTKANSIEGNKKDNINIVYTPWSNLKKDGSMATGQVGFKDQRKVKRILVETRVNAIINRLNKTKEERFPDLWQEKEDRLKVVRAKEKKAALERVRFPCFGGGEGLTSGCRRRRRRELRRNVRRLRGRGTMRTMMFSRRTRSRRTATRTEARITSTTLCERGYVLSMLSLLVAEASLLL